MFAGLLGVGLASQPTPCSAGHLSVVVQTTEQASFICTVTRDGRPIYRERLVFTPEGSYADTRMYEDGWTRVLVNVRDGCGYAATIELEDPRLGAPRTTPAVCVSWWQVGWFASHLGTVTFLGPASKAGWPKTRYLPSKDAQWGHDHPWGVPAMVVGSIAFFPTLILLFRWSSRRSQRKLDDEWRRKHGSEPPDPSLAGLLKIVGGGVREAVDAHERDLWTKRINQVVAWAKEREHINLDDYVRAHRDEILRREAEIRSAYDDSSDPCYTNESTRRVAEYAVTTLAGDLAYLPDERHRKLDGLIDLLRRHRGWEIEELLPRAKQLLVQERTAPEPPPPPEPTLEEEVKHLFESAETEAAAYTDLEKRLLQYDATLKADGVGDAPRQIRVNQRRTLMQAQLADLFARRKK